MLPPIALTDCLTICASAGQLGRLVRDQRRLPAWLEAGGRDQLLGLADVLVALRRRRRPDRGRIDRRERRVVAEIGVVVEQRLDDLRPVERERDRLAHALVVEDAVLLIDAHRDLAVRRAAGLEDLDVRVVEERAAVEEHDAVEQIELAADQRVVDRGALAERHVDAVERGRAAPPGRVALVPGADAGGVRHEIEGARGLRRLLERAGVVLRAG